MGSSQLMEDLFLLEYTPIPCYVAKQLLCLFVDFVVCYLLISAQHRI